MRPTNKTILTTLLLILICWLLLLAWCDKVWEEETYEPSLVEKKEMIQEQIVELQWDYAYYESELVRIHNEADNLREQINEINKELYWTEETIKVMDKICELSKESPMCNNWEMLHDLITVAEKRNANYKILLWIMYWESHIWVNFKPVYCWETNNWAWLKARKYDDGSVSEWFDKQEWKIEWCWLYKFDDVHTFFESLANTIWIWYAKCNNDVYCISKAYVWHESWAWVNNVWKFLSL